MEAPSGRPRALLRKHNFSGGPGELPSSVLSEAARAVEDFDGSGVSILGLSHRSARFAAVVEETVENVRLLAGVPPRYEVLLLQGGGTLQFSMASMHLARPGRPAAFVSTGYWSERAIAEARYSTDVVIAWSGGDGGFRRVPRDDEIEVPTDASFFHYVTNETVEGVQFDGVPGPDDVPRVADMSSDFLSRPHPIGSHAIVYAHAQKNLGPAGVTIVIVDGDVVANGPANVPQLLQYRAHAGMSSIYHTPPVFAVYVVLLVTRWILGEGGGLGGVAARNAQKAELLYAAVDRAAGFYVPHAELASRSVMNVTFRTPSQELDERLAWLADNEGFVGIAGHRSLGGIRVSNYNAVALESVSELCAFLDEFAKRHG